MCEKLFFWRIVSRISPVIDNQRSLSPKFLKNYDSTYDQETPDQSDGLISCKVHQDDSLSNDIPHKGSSLQEVVVLDEKVNISPACKDVWDACGDDGGASAEFHDPITEDNDGNAFSIDQPESSQDNQDMCEEPNHQYDIWISNSLPEEEYCDQDSPCYDYWQSNDASLLDNVVDQSNNGIDLSDFQDTSQYSDFTLPQRLQGIQSEKLSPENYETITDRTQWAWSADALHQCRPIGYHQSYSSENLYQRPQTSDQSRPLHLTDTIDDEDEPYEITLSTPSILPPPSFSPAYSC